MGAKFPANVALISPHHSGQESGGQLCVNFKIVIVSAVIICQQYLQTSLPSGELCPQTPAGASVVPGPQWGTSVLQTPWATLLPPISGGSRHLVWGARGAEGAEWKWGVGRAVKVYKYKSV